MTFSLPFTPRPKKILPTSGPLSDYLRLSYVKGKDVFVSLPSLLSKQESKHETLVCLRAYEDTEVIVLRRGSQKNFIGMITQLAQLYKNGVQFNLWVDFRPQAWTGFAITAMFEDRCFFKIMPEMFPDFY